LHLRCHRHRLRFHHLRHCHSHCRHSRHHRHLHCRRRHRQRRRAQNYPRLRSRSDYARGTLLYKRREQEKMLCWQNTVANKSLTDLDRDLVKESIAIRKSLLGYMGDKQMAFPETLAQNILFKGLDKPKLRDEAYLQVRSLTMLPSIVIGCFHILLVLYC
jgi:hypothetical protein